MYKYKKSHYFALLAASFAILLSFLGTERLLAQEHSERSNDEHNMVVSATQYAAFLNTAAKSDPHHLYDEKMTSDRDTACIVRLGLPGNFHYETIAGRENSPVCYVNKDDNFFYSSEQNLPIRESIEAPTSTLASDQQPFFVVTSASSSLCIASPRPSSSRSLLSLSSLGEIVGGIGLAAVGHEIMIRRGGEAASPHTQEVTNELEKSLESIALDDTSSRQEFSKKPTRRYPLKPSANTSKERSSTNDSPLKSIVPTTTIADYLNTHAQEHEQIVRKITPKMTGITDDNHPWKKAYFHSTAIAKKYSDAAETCNPTDKPENHPLYRTAAAFKEISDYRIKAAKCFDQSAQASEAGNREAAQTFADALADYTQAAEKRAPNNRKESDFLAKQAKKNQTTGEYLMTESNARKAAQYGISIHEAVQPIFSLLDAENSKESFDKMDSLMSKCIDIETSSASATIAADNITKLRERFLRSPEGPLIINDSLPFIAVDLALSDIQAATKEVISASLLIMSHSKYEGEVANKALTPLKAVDSTSFDKLFNDKKPIAINESSFPTLAAKQKIFQQAIEKAEAAIQYAESISDALHDVFEVIFFCNDYPTTEQQLAEPCAYLATTKSITERAKKNTAQRLDQLTNSVEDQLLAKETSQNDAKLLIAVDLAVNALKEAAENTISAANDIITGNEYSLSEWEEVKTQAATDLKEATDLFKAALGTEEPSHLQGNKTASSSYAKSHSYSEDPVSISNQFSAPQSKREQGLFEKNASSDVKKIPVEPDDHSSYSKNVRTYAKSPTPGDKATDDDEDPLIFWETSAEGATHH